jgi:hypothetical protein
MYTICIIVGFMARDEEWNDGRMEHWNMNLERYEIIFPFDPSFQYPSIPIVYSQVR